MADFLISLCVEPCTDALFDVREANARRHVARVESSEQEHYLFLQAAWKKCKRCLLALLVAEWCRPRSRHGQPSGVDRARVGLQFEGQSGSPEIAHAARMAETSAGSFLRGSRAGHLRAHAQQTCEEICPPAQAARARTSSVFARSGKSGSLCNHLCKLGWSEARRSPGKFDPFKISGVVRPRSQTVDHMGTAPIAFRVKSESG